MKTSSQTQTVIPRSSPWTGVGIAAAIVAGLVLAWPSSTRAAGLLIADGGFGGVLEIESHDVSVTVNNGIAVTEVTQVFRNTERRQVEALYTFPVPRGASVANFSMWIHGKEMVGEVVERKRARKIYESYKRSRRDPGLLEQTDYKTFKMRIFPIAPGARQKVKVRYYQQLECDGDWATYVYPLATAAGRGANSKTTGRFALSLHAKSQVPIVAMESPSHAEAFVMARHGDSYWQASLEVTGGDLRRDVVLAYRLRRARTGADVICSNVVGEEGYFCLTLTAGEELAGKTGPMDYVFVLDISGSMADDGKLDASRRCTGAFLDQLGGEDRFEVITFNVKPGTLFNRLRSADAEAKKAGAGFLSSRRAGGGTVLLSALGTAWKYRDPDRRLNVVIFSDGMTEQRGRGELLAAIRGRPGGVRVFCVGVGNEVNRPLLSRLAREAGGLAAFLSRGDNFTRRARSFRQKLTKPAMTHVRVAFDGGGVRDVEPQKLPDLYHGTPVRLYGRYRQAGAAKVTLQGDVNGTPFRREVKVTLPEQDRSNPEVERMWAWQRVQRLGGQLDAAAPDGAVVEEIVRLGEGYSIATEHTSFIVLENDAEYRRWQVKRRNQLRVSRDRSAHDALLGELETLRSASIAGLGPEAVGQGADDPGAEASPLSSQPKTPRLFPGLRLPRSGGGPVGPLGLAVIGLLAGAHLRRRRRAKAC